MCRDIIGESLGPAQPAVLLDVLRAAVAVTQHDESDTRDHPVPPHHPAGAGNGRHPQDRPKLPSGSIRGALGDTDGLSTSDLEFAGRHWWTSHQYHPWLGLMTPISRAGITKSDRRATPRRRPIPRPTTMRADPTRNAADLTGSALVSRRRGADGG
jgi:hypothetical protein